MLRQIILLSAGLTLASCQSEIDCGSTSAMNAAKKIASEQPYNKLISYILFSSPSPEAKRLQDEQSSKANNRQAAIDNESRKLAELNAKDDNSIQDCFRRYGRESEAAQRLFSNYITVDTFNNACQNPADRKPIETSSQIIKNVHQVNELLRAIDDMRAPVETGYRTQKEKVARLSSEIAAERQGTVQGYENRLQQMHDQARTKATYELSAIRSDAKDAQTGNLKCRADLTANIPDWGSARSTIAYTVQKTSDGGVYVQLFGLMN